MKYYSKNELINMAKDKIVLLENQNEALNNIAELISNHLRRLTAMDCGIDADYLPYNSMLIVASTGTGKSYIISKLCEIAGLPFSMISAGHLSAEGFKGLNLSQAIYSCQNNCADKNAFLDGIIFIDEFDKCKFLENVVGCPQFDFLTPIEGKGITVDAKGGNLEFIPTKRMLFIFAGAFEGLDKQILARLNKNIIGFSSSQTNEVAEDILTMATMKDIQNYGFSPELLGRIGLLQYIPPLKKSDYYTLLHGEGCTYEKKYASLYNVAGVDFSITDYACNIIANIACKSKVGARCLSTILQKELKDSFSQTDENKNITKVVLDGNEDKLFLNYIEDRNRKFKDMLRSRKLTDTVMKNINLAEYITTEKDINETCYKLLKCGRINNADDELLMFYFLQTCLRFMNLGLVESEQTTNTLSTLVKMLKIDKGPNTDFKILIEDLLCKSRKGYSISSEKKAEVITTQFFYKLFEEKCDIYTYSKISKYVNNIRYYFQGE